MSTKPTLTIDSQDLRDGLLLALGGLIDREEKRQAERIAGESGLDLAGSDRLILEAHRVEDQLIRGCATIDVSDIRPALGRRAHAMGRELAAVEVALGPGAPLDTDDQDGGA
jgi:hypothetical protein